MTGWYPAHHPKMDVPSDAENVAALLLYDYKWRRHLWRIGAFRAVDPLPPEQRELAEQRLQAKRKIAAIFLACRAARAKYPSPPPIRSSEGIPPGVYRHIGGGVYELDPTASASKRLVVGPKLRVIPGGRP